MLHAFFARRYAADRLADLHEAPRRTRSGRYLDGERQPRIPRHWTNR